MSAIIPPARPRISKGEIFDLLRAAGHDTNKLPAVVVVGLRGYYRDSMGAKGRNDFGIYDDAIFILSEGRDPWSFNANTDPSRYVRRKDGRGMAKLDPGRYVYAPGWHGYGRPSGHQAFRQRGPVRITRFGGQRQTGQFAINIHRGGWRTTSSEGCQTLPPGQFEDFRETINNLLGWYGMKTFDYILVEAS